MRPAIIAFIVCLMACSETERAPAPSRQDELPVTSTSEQPPLVMTFTETPSLEQAVAFTDMPTEAPQSWRIQQMSGVEGADYIALLEIEPNPVSHHPYLYTVRRSGDWVAYVWRNGDGTNESVSYYNVKTGAGIGTRFNQAGEIRTLTIRQQADDIDDRRVPTGEHTAHLGERCAIWRSQPRGPGFQSLSESCITNDGIELWLRTIGTGHPTRPDYVRLRWQVSSLRRGHIDPSLARPRPEWFDWSYWRARATALAAISDNTPPDHTIWFEDQVTARRGRVIMEQYRNNWRTSLSHHWYEIGNSHAYTLQGPNLSLVAQSDAGHRVYRSVEIELTSHPLRWRPDPAIVRRDGADTIIGRRCHWLRPINPPEDASWSECWTDDNFVLARSRFGRAGGSGEHAVRLDTSSPTGPFAPPRSVLEWARAMAD